MKKISIVVLTYNHQEFIERTLEGIFMQKTSYPIELLLSNDASTDNTAKVIQDCLKNKPEAMEVKFFDHKKNKGATPNFYQTLKEATGDYLAFCEGDDYWTDTNKLQLQVDFLEQNPNYSLVFHNVMNDSSHEQYKGKMFSAVKDKDYSSLEIYEHWIVHTASVVLRSETLKSEAFQKTLKDPTLLYFDTALFLAASTLGKLRGLSDCMSAYRRHEMGISFGHNLKKDLRHNHLDTIIQSYYGSEISQFARWQIFTRSKNGFLQARKNKDFSTAFKFLTWMLKDYKLTLRHVLKTFQ